jgi:DNA-directed RNA polymerase specialized sigma24 family protein
MATSEVPSPIFATTRWSVVLAAQQSGSSSAFEALESLCCGYWYPIYAYVRRRGYSPHDAQDLTQEFFSRLIQRDWLHAAAPGRGRFRTLLIVAMKRLLAKEWHRAQAQKRGAGSCPVSIDVDAAEQRYLAEPALSADAVFERRWALTIVDDALGRLEAEYSGAGRAAEFVILAEWLTAGRGEIPYAELSARLSVAEGAARVAVHRMRKRFRALFRERVAETLGDEGNLQDEIRHLAAALRGGV